MKATTFLKATLMGILVFILLLQSCSADTNTTSSVAVDVQDIEVDGKIESSHNKIPAAASHNVLSRTRRQRPGPGCPLILLPFGQCERSCHCLRNQYCVRSPYGFGRCRFISG
ncbi:unnamed protein product [Orchesella dallaii]|uniref:Uncharacterized protein n=1 Tax=Orchesella dallaii TaxID=48710 RepID=A0ABP1RHI3_9HEXA